jgi:hypothetical protein
MWDGPDCSMNAPCASTRGDRDARANLTALEGSAGWIDQRLLAFVETALSAAVLEEYLAGCLPDSMRPSQLHTLERLPVTPAGKLDRLALT